MQYVMLCNLSYILGLENEEFYHEVELQRYDVVEV